jgi:hypothetical protein
MYEFGMVSSVKVGKLASTANSLLLHMMCEDLCLYATYFVSAKERVRCNLSTFMEENILFPVLCG